MSKLLLDTNILLDVVDVRRPESQQAREVLRDCNGGGDMGFACATSLKDVYYVLGKFFGEKKARELTSDLMGFVIILPIGAEECDLAIHSNEPDFEDGLVRAAAELEGVDFILTRDRAAFGHSHIRSMSCAEFLTEIHEN